MPTLSRANGARKIKRRAENLALTEIRNVSSLRASPRARSAGTGALQGRCQLFQSTSERADKGPRYAVSAGIYLAQELLPPLSLLLCERPPLLSLSETQGFIGAVWLQQQTASALDRFTDELKLRRKMKPSECA